MTIFTQEDVVRVAAGLSKAQRAAVASAAFREQAGVWHPRGWYLYADKRVRYALALANVIRDYLRPVNRLTPLGLAVRNHLKETTK